jgi:crossover junction endodeoxyribonuclease RusA
MSPSEEFKFFVPGTPQTKGSTRAFIPKGWKRAIITNDNKKAKPWEGAILAEASSHCEFLGVLAVTIEAEFVFSRPKGHFGKKGLKPSAPMKMTKKPDIDKVTRVVLDGLTGVVYPDDCQVDECRLRKRYAEPGEAPGVHITVRPS